MQHGKQRARQKGRSVGAVVAAAAAALCGWAPPPSTAQSPTIVEIRSSETTGTYDVRIQALSADGSTAVGMRNRLSRWQAARWNSAGELTILAELPDTPPGSHNSEASAISADGAVTVGYSRKYFGAYDGGNVPVRWDAVGAVAELGTFSDYSSLGKRATFAHHVSGDGSRAAGKASRYSYFGNYVGDDAVVWNADGSIVPMDNLGGVSAPGIRQAEVDAISFHGDVIAGNWLAYTPAPTRAPLGVRPVKWEADGSATELPTLGQSSGSVAHAEIRALSKYGQIAFGFSDKYVQEVLVDRVAVRWDAANDIGEIVVPGTNGDALGCSDSGDEAFGTYVDANGVTRGFRWTLAGGAVDLGALNGTGLCVPKAMSRDGRTIVGASTAADSYGGAFVWRAGQMTSLWSLLLAYYQFDPASHGWQRLDEALFCSADGSVIVGKGTKSDGQTAHFRLELPTNEPPTIASDLVEAGETIQVPLGSTFSATFSGADGNGDDLALEATGLPASAVLTPTAGTVSASPATAELTFAPTAADVGTHEATISFRDDAGVAATIAFTLVVPANSVPTLTALTPVVVECQGDQNLVTLSTTVDDADAGHLLTVTWKVDGVAERTDSGVVPGASVDFEHDYPHGESVVTVEVGDGYDQATTSSAVTVEDTIAPLIVLAGDLVVPADPGLDVASNVVLPTPEVHDLCDEEPTLTNDAPATYPLGDTIVAWTAVDEFGNSATVTQLVTVEDREAPLLLGGSDVTVPVDAGEIFATVALSEPDVVDNADVDVDVVSDAPATYPLGETVVTWTATDDAGNQATWSLTVTVVNQAPVADAGGDVTLVSTKSAGIDVTLDGSGSSDADGHDLTFAWSAGGIVFDDPASQTPTARFPNGETTVALTVTDEAGAQTTTTIVVTLDYQPLRIVDTRQHGAGTSFYVDETNRLVNELHAALGYPSTYDWNWAVHYCYWSKYYDDLAESVTYEGPEDYESQLALYKSYRNPQVGCSQLLVTHFSRCSPGVAHPRYAEFLTARQVAIWGRDYGWTDYFQP